MIVFRHVMFCFPGGKLIFFKMCNFSLEKLHTYDFQRCKRFINKKNLCFKMCQGWRAVQNVGSPICKTNLSKFQIVI